MYILYRVLIAGGCVGVCVCNHRCTEGGGEKKKEEEVEVRIVT